MAPDDAVSPHPVSASRRAVLRTGAKLAYAAPVMAASMTLAASNTGAQVSGSAACLEVGVSCLDAMGQCCAGTACGDNRCEGTIFTCLRNHGEPCTDPCECNQGPCCNGTCCTNGLCVNNVCVPFE